MKILVPVKKVMDYKATVRIKADGSSVDTAQAKMLMNPFDEIAVEEAVRWKEQGKASEVIAVSIGTDACQEILRTALAMGADRALLVKTDIEVQPLAAAKILKKIVEQEHAQIVILGKQAIDTDNNQTGQMLAGLLNWPQATFASNIEFQDDVVCVTREVDGGLETLSLTLPAVITTDLRLNEPRYLSLPNIMQAKHKSITTIAADTLSIDLNARQKIIKVSVPEKRRSCVRLANAAELVKRLKDEAKVLS
jgi:electron transfer flavoprotein beta subunit